MITAKEAREISIKNREIIDYNESCTILEYITKSIETLCNIGEFELTLRLDDYRYESEEFLNYRSIFYSEVVLINVKKELEQNGFIVEDFRDEDTNRLYKLNISWS